MGRITDENVDRVFSYREMSAKQIEDSAELYGVFRSVARTVLRLVPASADRSAALRALREARMWANSAVALRGEV